MNKKGQTLIVFVLLLPLVLLFLAFVVDTGILIKEQIKSNSTLKSILITTYKDKEQVGYEEEIKELLMQNQLPIEGVKIKKNQDEVSVALTYEKESIFGQIIGIKTYKIQVKLKAMEEQNQIKIVKE